MNPIPSQSIAPELANDAGLVRCVLDRRPEALAELYDRFAPVLLALARRILGSAGDAEEVVQEVFLHLWNHPDRYDPGRSSVSTWLLLLARSRSIDRLRTRQVVERTHDSASAERKGDTSPAGPESVLHRERHERVRREMEDLPPEQRQVIEMAFYQGLSQTEIAARADLPLGTVKTRTLLAMKKLRNALRSEVRQLL